MGSRNCSLICGSRLCIDCIRSKGALVQSSPCNVGIVPLWIGTRYELGFVDAICIHNAQYSSHLGSSINRYLQRNCRWDTQQSHRHQIYDYCSFGITAFAAIVTALTGLAKKNTEKLFFAVWANSMSIFVLIFFATF